MSIKEQSRKFNQEFNHLANQYFKGGKTELHSWIIDTFHETDIGTGSYLQAQPSYDYNDQKDNPFFASNLKDEKLSENVMHHNPTRWFIYSSSDSIARPLTQTDMQVISKALKSAHLAHYQYHEFIPDEQKAEKQLKELA